MKLDYVELLLLLGSFTCMLIGVIFIISSNAFLAIVCLITSSFFSSARNSYKLKKRIDYIEEFLYKFMKGQ